MGNPTSKEADMHVVIGDTTLIAPHTLSDMCEQTAMRVARLDGEYKALFDELLEADYEPQTEDGLYDLQRLQRATWGRLGY